MQASILYFDQFELDLNSYELRKAGRVIKLEKLPMELLILLVEKQGELVTREEIIQRLWGDNVFVDTRQGINTAVRKIRVALHDDPEHSRLLQTVAGRGYRLLPPVSAEDKNTPEQAAPQIPLPPPLPTPESPTSSRIGVHPQGNLQVTSPQKRPPVAAIVAVFVTLLAIASLVVILVHWHRTAVKPPAGTAFSNMRITQLTSMPGQYWDPAFSPDGRQISYFWDGENRVKGDLYVQLVGGANPLRLTHTSTGFICCADWSPDGQQIVFARCDDHGGSIIIIPALGGSERKLTDVVCWEYRVGFPQWTADGKSLVLVDSCTPAARPGIVIFSLQTGEKRCLDSPPPSDMDFDPVLSPDGKTVAFHRWATSVAEIYTVAISGGNLRQLTNEAFDNWPLWLMWSPDGKYIVFEPTRDRLAHPGVGWST